MQALPVDVLLSIVDELDLAGKASLSLCSKVYYSLFNGRDIFHRLRLERLQLSSFLECLERDIPVENLFCPTCLKFHKFEILPTAQIAPVHATTFIRPRSPRPPIDNTDGGFRSWWACVKDDWRNEICLFYGLNVGFCQARMALKLHREHHPQAQEYLESMNQLKIDKKVKNMFMCRQMRILPGAEGHFPLLFMRIQQWWLNTKRDLKIPESLIGEGRQEPLLCYHRTDPYVEFGGKRAALAIQARRLILAMESATDENENAERRRFSFGLNRTKVAHSTGGIYRQIHPNHTEHDDSITPSSPDHEHSLLDHCFQCSTDFRLDAIRLTNNPHPTLPLSIHGRGYAIVLTKWMNLGTLGVQNSKEWQGHAYAKPRETLVRTSPQLRNGELMKTYEGHAQYCPVWSNKLEAEWKQELKGKKDT